jgi:hypothetical protein
MKLLRCALATLLCAAACADSGPPSPADAARLVALRCTWDDGAGAFTRGCVPLDAGAIDLDAHGVYVQRCRWDEASMTFSRDCESCVACPGGRPGPECWPILCTPASEPPAPARSLTR